jgi:hypothetical protein
MRTTARINELDQQENDRREKEDKRIALMLPLARQAAKEVEEARRQKYDDDRLLMIQTLH